MKLSILITLLNEELVLPQTHREISNQLEQMLGKELSDYEILYIDDGSSDKTFELIEEFAREMFKAGSNLKDKSPEEIFYQDYKKFIAEGDICFGVGQISSMDADELREIKERLIQRMRTSWCIKSILYADRYYGAVYRASVLWRGK